MPIQIQLTNLQSPRKNQKISLRQIQSSNTKNLISNRSIPDQQKLLTDIKKIDTSNQSTQKNTYYKKKSKKYRQKDESNLQSNVAYPEATIREYLNQKRTTQNKICHCLFCVFMIVVIMLLGVGFFYGNYELIGQTIPGSSTSSNIQPCTAGQYVNQQMASCEDNCSSGTLYINKICVTSTAPYYPYFSTDFDKQITMYTLKQTFIPIIYGTISTLAITTICFLLLVCFSKAIYLYIGLTFIMLLAFAFFLMKNVQDTLEAQTKIIQGPGSIFYENISNILPLCYILMAFYLIIFPFVIFSPYKISTATKIIAKMRKYFIRMRSVNLFTYLIIYVTWGLLILQIYSIFNIFTAGEQSTQSNAFFYVFTNVKLSHPAVLVLHFFGIYWFFSTLVCWHKYFTSNAMCLWYFQQGHKLFPVTRGLKRSWHNLGTAALDALLLPFQWLTLIMYTICKYSNQEQQKIKDNKQSDSLQLTGCTSCIRGFFNSLYCKLNTNSFASAPLTNYPLQQSCQISAVTFAYHNHKFFNLGGTLTILLTLFNCLVFLIINYIILYTEVYNITTPPPITSLGLPMLIVFFISITLGAMQANMYTAALDCLIFCFLLEKKSNVQNTKNQLKDILEMIWHDDGDQLNQEKVQIYQYQQD